MRTYWLSAFLLLISFENTCAIGEGLDLNAFTGIIGGIGSMFRGVKTVDVDINKMMGKWFQMYKAAINFDVFRTNMFCQVAYFSPNPVMGSDGFSIEEAYRVISKSGPIETYKRDVTKSAPGAFWMYTEEYFYPRQFYVMRVGPNPYLLNDTEPYDYMIVTDSNKLALMVFARDPVEFHQLYNEKVLEYLTTNGFGGNVFWNAPKAIYQGSDCQWPSKKEVFARRVLKNKTKNNRAPVSQLNPLQAVQGIVGSGILGGGRR